MFCLKDLKTYFKWKCERFRNIPCLSQESVNSFFPSPQRSLPFYFILGCYFQFQYVEMWGTERRREGELWPSLLFYSSSVLTQAANSALSCNVCTLCDPVQSCRRAIVTVQASSTSTPAYLHHPMVLSGLQMHVHSQSSANPKRWGQDVLNSVIYCKLHKIADMHC